MNYFNSQKIQELLSKGKELSLQKVAPLVLTGALSISLLATPVSAASITFEENKANYSNGELYVTKADAVSTNFNAQQEADVTAALRNIDTYFQNFYNILANGGNGYTKENILVRYMAELDKATNNVNSITAKFNYSQKNYVQRYFASKQVEAKLVVANLCNIKISEIDTFVKTHKCTYKSYSNNVISNRYVDTYDVKNGAVKYDSQNVVVFDDTKLTTDKTLIVTPKVDITYNQNQTPNFRQSYDAVIVENKNINDYNNAISALKAEYDRIDEALKNGIYTSKNNQPARDLYISLLGDMNYIDQQVKVNDAVATNVNKYINYRKLMALKTFYEKNRSKCSFVEIATYHNNNYVIRVKTEGSYTQYNVHPRPYNANNFQAYLIYSQGVMSPIDNNQNQGEYYYIDNEGNIVYIDADKVNFYK